MPYYGSFQKCGVTCSDGLNLSLRLVATMSAFSPSSSTRSLFFFSSRRRHTRSLCDWSSDVCSSDLSFSGGEKVRLFTRPEDIEILPSAEVTANQVAAKIEQIAYLGDHIDYHVQAAKIGRASCRERVEISVVGVLSKIIECDARAVDV